MQVAPVPQQGSLPGREARTGRQQCAGLRQSDRLAAVCECGFLCWTERPLLRASCVHVLTRCAQMPSACSRAQWTQMSWRRRTSSCSTSPHQREHPEAGRREGGRASGATGVHAICPAARPHELNRCLGMRQLPRPRQHASQAGGSPGRGRQRRAGCSTGPHPPGRRRRPARLWPCLHNAGCGPPSAPQSSRS